MKKFCKIMVLFLHKHFYTHTYMFRDDSKKKAVGTYTGMHLNDF